MSAIPESFEELSAPITNGKFVLSTDPTIDTWLSNPEISSVPLGQKASGLSDKTLRLYDMIKLYHQGLLISAYVKDLARQTGRLLIKK